MSATRFIDGSQWMRAVGRIFLAAVFCLVANGASPRLSATLNGTIAPVLFRGHAGVFEVDLMHPDMWEATLQPIRIEFAGGVAWTNAVKLQIQNAAGTQVAWPLWMRPVTDASMTLDAERMGKLFFLLSEADSAVLAEGEYKAQFILDTRTNAAAGAWSGLAKSVAMEVRVAAAPVTLSAAQLRRKQVALSQYHALRGDGAAARAAADVLVAAQPRSLEARRAKAAVLSASGDVAGAVLEIDQALLIFAQDRPDAPEPPRELLRLREALEVEAGVRITSATALNGQIAIVWAAEVGARYRVESTANLKDWRTEQSGILVGNWSGGFDGRARFYRVVTE